jgi:hypothetical protein
MHRWSASPCPRLKSKPHRMRNAPPVGRSVGGATGCPLRSTAPPTEAAAPLKMGAKNESISISAFHVATNSGVKKCHSGWTVLGEMVTSPVSSCTRAPSSGRNARESRLPDPASTPGGRPSCSGVAPAGKEPFERPFRRQGTRSPRRERGSAGFSRPGTCRRRPKNQAPVARTRTWTLRPLSST